MGDGQTYAWLVEMGMAGNRHALDVPEIMIGRGTACQIQIKDPKVSRQHARIRFIQGVINIEDLESSQGTLVNGRRVSSAELRDGDELTLGDTRLRIESAPDAVATVMADEIWEEATIACRRCGEKSPLSVRFCAACGEPLHAPISQTSPTPPAQPISPAPAIPAPVPQATSPPLAQTGREKVSGRRWLAFLLGLGIPIFLGVVGVLVLVLLGFFDEQPLPEPEIHPPAVAQPTSEEESPDFVDAPPFVFRAFDPGLDGDLPTQTDLAVYSETDNDDVALYEIPLSTGQEIVLDYFYCGTSEGLLVDISQSIQITFEIDGVIYPQGTLYRDTLVRETRACYVYQGVLGELTPGEHTLVQTMSVDKQIYDGWETWGPEDLVSQIRILVEG